ncbi:MAG: ImmA/IrrE family metallo-endopeptidase [Cyanobacteria bacterium P01_G01_bin.54]
MPIIKPLRFLAKHDIECRALDVLESMRRAHDRLPNFPLDTSVVAEFLGLDVVWDSIPDDGAGQIAARILPLERLIEINEDLPQIEGGLGESTLAHEIGHWVLHIDQEAIARVERLQTRQVRVNVVPLLCREEAEELGREWQAQYFATCLLMPRFVMEPAVAGKDLQQWRSLYAITEELGVTISNLIHRLKDLGWISEAPARVGGRSQE